MDPKNIDFKNIDFEVNATAPSSTMLFGEHAVLRKKTAIVAAIDRHITIYAKKRLDEKVKITSALKSAETTRRELELPYELRYLRGALRLFQEEMTTGVELVVSSDVPHTVGLGSSASITVASVASLLALFRPDLTNNRQEIMRRAFAVVQSVQGSGSGADIASVVYGGVISFQTEGLHVEALADTLPIHLIYCGYKTPTAEVIERIHHLEHHRKSLVQPVFDMIEIISLHAKEAIRKKDLPEVGFLMNTAHGCMEALGISTQELSAIAWQARMLPHVWGSKISGSGLGDSVVVLGDVDPKHIHTGVYIPAPVSPYGVHITWKEN